MFTLAFLVFGAAIFAFFSEEIIDMIKKLFTIPGVKLVIPLMIASWMIEKYEQPLYTFLKWCIASVDKIVLKLGAGLPFDTHSLLFTRILSLFLLATLPIWMSFARIKRRDSAKKAWSLTHRICLFLWIILAVILVAPR